MTIYDLSQPLNQDCSFWPFYPPFEVKYIKRKSEQGVNAQYIQTSNHMGTHLDAPRHFVTNGKTIDQIPLEWLYGPGVIVDLSDVLDELDVFTPEMIEERVEVRDGDILFIHTGWHKYGEFWRGPRRREVHPPPPRPALQHLRLAAGEEDPRLGRGHDLHRPSHEPAHRPLSGPGRAGALAEGAPRSARKSSAPIRSTSSSPTRPTS